MDCRNFKDILDSYLSGELAVETNHAVQQHAEQCGDCRTEMGARRHLRGLLRAAATKLTISAEGQERLRARLRADETPRVPFLTRSNMQAARGHRSGTPREFTMVESNSTALSGQSAPGSSRLAAAPQMLPSPMSRNVQ